MRTIKIEVAVTMGLAGCKKQETIPIQIDEDEEFDIEAIKEAVARDYVFNNMIEWGWADVNNEKI